MFQHLLVPLDGSAVSERALPSALEIAAAFGSRIALLRVVLVPGVIGGHGNEATEPYVVYLENRYREAEAYITEMVASLQSNSYHMYGLILQGRSVADVVLEAADLFAVDGIVMGTHGRGGLYRWLLGSVADKVVRCSSMPVLLVPTLANPDHLRKYAALTAQAPAYWTGPMDDECGC